MEMGVNLLKEIKNISTNSSRQGSCIFQNKWSYPQYCYTLLGIPDSFDIIGCYDDLKGLNFSAASLDRKILTSMSEEDWVDQAKYIQEHLPDTVIEQAIALLPENAYKESGAMIIEILKDRRNQLVLAAKEYYKIIAREVNVTGSDDRELFERAERLNSESTLVSVYALTDDGTKKEQLFKRVLNTKETREINLYGFGGDDIFNLRGKAKKGIQIRITGGDGKI